MASEIANLSAILDNPQRPLLGIIGGSKLSTKLGLIGHLVDQVDWLCLGGAMAATFLKAADLEVGRSIVEEDFQDQASAVVRQAAERHIDLQLPIDVVVAPSPPEVGSGRRQARWRSSARGRHDPRHRPWHGCALVGDGAESRDHRLERSSGPL